MGIGSRIRDERERLGYTQLDFAALGGASKNSQLSWEKDVAAPNANVLSAWAAKGADVLYILTGARAAAIAEPVAPDHVIKSASASGAPAEDWSDFAQVPRYDVRASAGLGALVDGEHVLDHMAFRRDWLIGSLGLRLDRLALLEVDGDSMQPTLTHGDMILIDTRKDRGLTDGMYVMNLGGRLLVKRLNPRMDGAVEITSDNDMYPPETVRGEQLDQLHVAGRVVWHGRRV